MGTTSLHMKSEPASNVGDDPAGNCSRDFERLWPQDQSHSVTCSRKSASTRLTFNGIHELGATVNDPVNNSENVHQSITPSIDTTRTTREHYIAHTASEYILSILDFWFIVPTVIVRNHMAKQFKEMKGSRRRRIMYIGAMVLQAFNQGPWPRDCTFERCMGWINRFEQNTAVDLRKDPLPSDAADFLAAYLELALLKFVLVDGASGYAVLRNALPKFLQFVAADSNLLIEQSDGSLVVSFPGVTWSYRYEIVRFVVYDVVLAFLLGVASLAEYGYDDTCEPNGSAYEWIYGIPATLLQIIQQVNSWRAGSRVRLDAWQALERRVVEWESPYTALLRETSTSGSVDIERAIVQEGWRHTLLIYIYMGICGVSSHDSRIQTSADRIFRLAEMIGSSRVGIHMLPHCVVAGVVARLEGQRAAVYNKLNSLKDARPWLFPGPQFNRLLYHLWHGAGARGGAVTWGDYVHSRQAVIPI